LRAPRFKLHLVVRYRRVEDAEWRGGETENISHSGVLIRAADPIEVDTRVELRVRLALAAQEREPAEVCCRGRVVRTVPPGDDRAWPGSAIAIEQYDFVPPGVSFSMESSPESVS